MILIEQNHIELLIEASLIGMHSVVHTPNRQSWFERPLVGTCSQHYGAAFFYAGDKEKLDKAREILQRELGLIEVTEDSKPAWDALLERHLASSPESGL